MVYKFTKIAAQGLADLFGAIIYNSINGKMSINVGVADRGLWYYLGTHALLTDKKITNREVHPELFLLYCVLILSCNLSMIFQRSALESCEVSFEINSVDLRKK